MVEKLGILTACYSKKLKSRNLQLYETILSYRLPLIVEKHIGNNKTAGSLKKKITGQSEQSLFGVN